MDKSRIAATLFLASMLLACERSQAPEETASPSPTLPETAETNAGADPAEALETAIADANRSNDGHPDLNPPVLVPEAERGIQGARNLLLSFARAIELKETDQAWALLSPVDRGKWSKTQFAALFADLGKLNVAIPTGKMEDEAGSSTYRGPITITGADKDGRPVRLEGEAVLRRVDDGATAAQNRWHFETLSLDWTH